MEGESLQAAATSLPCGHLPLSIPGESVCSGEAMQERQQSREEPWAPGSPWTQQESQSQASWPQKHS